MLCGWMLASTTFASAEIPQDAQFDEEQLKSLGIGAGVAEYFRHGARFSPGAQIVDVTVNGLGMGKINAIFNATGDLCFTKEFTRSVGLVDIEEALLRTLPDRYCADYRAFSSRALITLKPTSGTVDITVPAEHLVPVPNSDVFDSGGVGAMLNYRAYATQSKLGGGASIASKYVDTQAGLNLNDWIFRSDQSLSIDDGVQRFNWSGAYVKKSFLDRGKMLQFGRINVQDPLFGGLPINGFQWIPESAARSEMSYAVTGMASTRSTVEIRQNGLLLLRTIVPPGPFSLSDYPLRNSSSDLQVSVVGDAGSTQSFTVPATLLMQSLRRSFVSGLHVSAGKLWRASRATNEASPLVATASKGWRLLEVTGTNGALLSHGYASTGAQINVGLDDAQKHALFLQAITTHDIRNSAHGISTGGGLISQLSDSFSAGASLNVRAGKYRALQQASGPDSTAVDESSRSSVQSSLTATWNDAWLGGINGSVTQDKSAFGDIGRTYSVGWSSNWRGANFALGLSHSTFKSSFEASGRNRGNTYFYANLSIPLGSPSSMRSHLRYQGASGQIGSSFSTQLQQIAQVTMSTDRSFGASSAQSSSVSVATVPRYTSVDFGTTQSASASSFYGSATGSIVATRSGIAMSPHAAQDSFGIVRTADVTGVRIETPGGAVWSGPFGLAAVPYYNAYRESRIEVATNSVGLDIEIDRGLLDVKAARGAVIDLDLGMRRVRRVVLTVRDGEGNLLRTGSSVTNEKGEMLAVSLARGKVLVASLYDDSVLYAQDLQGRRCSIRDIRLNPKSKDSLFDSGVSVCLADVP